MRRAEVGGGILDSALDRTNGFLRRARRAILLVHGFNVPVAEARLAYRAFRANLGPPWDDDTAILLWPGDAATPWAQRSERRGFVSRTLSKASYPLQIGRAERCARILTSFFTDLFQARAKLAARTQSNVQPIELCIVAHSLGTLLTLELLERLRSSQATNMNLRLLVLMAAAIPQRLVSEDGALRQALIKDARVRVLHSKSDWVLLGAFRPGQALAGLIHWAGWAVGRHGASDTDFHPDLRNERKTGFGHGDYWEDPGVARDVARDLRSLTPPPPWETRYSGRRVAGRALPEQRRQRRTVATARRA